MIRRMYHTCKLVHADLSEYNILYHAGALYIIDVSQSVEHDHPAAYDFLRKDLQNVEEFFGRYGVRGLGLRRAFEFVTRDKLNVDGEEGGEDTVLEKWLERDMVDEPRDEMPPSSNGLHDITSQPSALSAHEDSVFMRSYIPRTLDDVYDPERDVDALNRGEGKNLIYADTIGLVEPSPEDPPTQKPKPTVRFQAGGEDAESSGDESEGVSEDDSEDESEGKGDGAGEEDGEDGEPKFEDRKPRGHRHEDREAKKVCLTCTVAFSWRRLTTL